MLNILDKAVWFPEEGKRTINEWITSYKKSRDDFKAAADESYKSSRLLRCRRKTANKEIRKKIRQNLLHRR